MVQMMANELEWSHPTNPNQLGSCLIIGGSKQEFAVVNQAYQKLNKVFLNTKIIVPNSVKTLVGNNNSDIIFCDSTPSGSIAQKSYDTSRPYINSANVVLMCGSMSKNSETAIFAERVASINKLKVLCGDTLDFFSIDSTILLSNQSNIIIASFKQVRHLVNSISGNNILLYKDTTYDIKSKLKNITHKVESLIIMEKEGVIYIAHKGSVATNRDKGGFSEKYIDLACLICEWSVSSQDNLFEAAKVAVEKLK